ncbi:hypothetical protein F2Q70_00024949 [Brassica cretica]|uniref:Uncharacterized protein n=1 Tax=Brassica cretica TaxID=69181 RepID=A0A8S9LE95_BRACR|nr:hypothetical protein F2Q70_00024949 [Brassica cretica]
MNAKDGSITRVKRWDHGLKPNQIDPLKAIRRLREMRYERGNQRLRFESGSPGRNGGENSCHKVDRGEEEALDFVAAEHWSSACGHLRVRKQSDSAAFTGHGRQKTPIKASSKRERNTYPTRNVSSSP